MHVTLEVSFCFLCELSWVPNESFGLAQRSKFQVSAAIKLGNKNEFLVNDKVADKKMQVFRLSDNKTLRTRLFWSWISLLMIQIGLLAFLSSGSSRHDNMQLWGYVSIQLLNFAMHRKDCKYFEVRSHFLWTNMNLLNFRRVRKLQSWKFHFWGYVTMKLAILRLKNIKLLHFCLKKCFKHENAAFENMCH